MTRRSPTGRSAPPPPLENIPNTVGEDPHGAPRGAPQAVQLMSDFLQPNGAVTNVCGATACFAGGFTGARRAPVSPAARRMNPSSDETLA